MPMTLENLAYIAEQHDVLDVRIDYDRQAVRVAFAATIIKPPCTFADISSYRTAVTTIEWATNAKELRDILGY